MITSRAIESALQSAVDDGTFPGAVLAVRLHGELVYEGAVGRLSPEPSWDVVTGETMYDLASLTKVLATTTAIVLAVQEGRLDLAMCLEDVLTELEGSPVGRLQVRHLLTHSSGLPGWRPFYERIAERDSCEPGFLGSAAARKAVIRYIREEALLYETGSRSLYSDLGFMLLGFVIERVAGEPLDTFCATRMYEPLAARQIGYVPRAGTNKAHPFGGNRSIAPTEVDPWRGRLLCGEVHDENAYALGGVAGHAGLFGTARGVLAVSQGWMEAYRTRQGLLDPHLVKRFVTRQTVPNSTWALGWDTPSAPSSSGRKLSAVSFGHLGYTGTSLWIDPIRELEIVLLSNRVHPTRRNERIREFRPKIHDLVCGELLGL
jgi:CubicO group peptidase (beta-lactamase class C family)